MSSELIKNVGAFFKVTIDELVKDDHEASMGDAATAAAAVMSSTPVSSKG